MRDEAIAEASPAVAERLRIEFNDPPGAGESRAAGHPAPTKPSTHLARPAPHPRGEKRPFFCLPAPAA